MEYNCASRTEKTRSYGMSTLAPPSKLFDSAFIHRSQTAPVMRAFHGKNKNCTESQKYSTSIITPTDEASSTASSPASFEDRTLTSSKSCSSSLSLCYSSASRCSRNKKDLKLFTSGFSMSQPCLPVKESGPTKIFRYLYLGSQEDALCEEIMKKTNIKYVLNLSQVCPKPDFIDEDKFLRIPVNDTCSEKLLPYFEDGFAFIDRARADNSVILVHCLAGISRSPTLAIAYVMRATGRTCDEAYKFVKDKRPAISPNFNFLGQLLDFEKQLDPKHKMNGCPSGKDDTSGTFDLHQIGAAVPPCGGGTSKFMKRSASAPLKIQKVNSEVSGLRLNLELTSPDSARNRNGKREISDCPVVITNHSLVDDGSDDENNEDDGENDENYSLKSRTNFQTTVSSSTAFTRVSITKNSACGGTVSIDSCADSRPARIASTARSRLCTIPSIVSPTFDITFEETSADLDCNTEDFSSPLRSPDLVSRTDSWSKQSADGNSINSEERAPPSEDDGKTRNSFNKMLNRREEKLRFGYAGVKKPNMSLYYQAEPVVSGLESPGLSPITPDILISPTDTDLGLGDESTGPNSALASPRKSASVDSENMLVGIRKMLKRASWPWALPYLGTISTACFLSPPTRENFERSCAANELALSGQRFRSEGLLSHHSPILTRQTGILSNGPTARLLMAGGHRSGHRQTLNSLDSGFSERFTFRRTRDADTESFGSTNSLEIVMAN